MRFSNWFADRARSTAFLADPIAGGIEIRICNVRVTTLPGRTDPSTKNA